MFVLNEANIHGCCSVPFHIHQLPLILHNETCVALANLQKLDSKLDLP